MSTAAAAEAARFARLEALVDAALEQPAAERPGWLQQQCADDPALCAEARQLLLAIDRSQGFLEPSAAPATDGRDLAGQSVGAWRLLRQLGRGGSGEVWLGERADGRFEQLVAVKLLHLWDDATVARFRREQALLARLEHPGIARLIDAGVDASGRPYMVMEYVQGATLTGHCRQQRLGVPARLALFDQVCDAVAHAHRHLVVHCDLKPQNILVRGDGRVALLDFGIAQLLDRDARAGAAAHTRSVRLTPQYAAPEQLAGTALTTQTDVYALGLLLHELLSGQSPWGALPDRGPLALLQRAMAAAPPPPSTQVASRSQARMLAGDLDAIVGKALRPEPGSRYASVEALRDDLQRHRTRQPVRARGDAFAYRLQRGLRRYWVAASVALLCAASLLGGSAAVLLAQQHTAQERDTARTEAMRAKAVRDYLGHMFREAGQRSGATPVTAKQVLEQAAARIDSTFREDPATAAQVLHALGELHLYLNDYAGAEPLLRHWLSHEDRVDDPDTAADVRFALAEAVFRMGQLDEAVQLLHAAQSYWQAAPRRHAERLLTSRMLQSQLERQRGDVELGIDTLERSLAQRLQRSGREHFESAALMSNLGAAYIQAGQLQRGIASSREALQLWRALGLHNGSDALNTLNNLAAAHFRSGDLEQAAIHFEQALALRREVYGPSAATAALIGNYARVLQRRGAHAEALALAEEAEPMALAHAGEASPLTLSLRTTRAELLLAQQRLAEAQQLLQQLESAAQVPGALQLRIGIARATLQRDIGQISAARSTLLQLHALADRIGAPAQALRPELEALQRSLADAGAGPAAAH